MTLQTFLNLTATIPEPTVRQAFALALSVERPTSSEDYARFYRRVEIYNPKLWIGRVKKAAYPFA